MANAFQFKRGTTARRLLYTPVDGELLYDKTLNTLYMGNGTTAGGVLLDSTDNTKRLKDLSLVNGIQYTDIASMYLGGATVTGAVVIHLPVAKGTATTMMQITIKGYNYLTNGGAFNLLCGFYQYGNTAVIQHSAFLSGSFPTERVRYARAGDHTVIILGDFDSKWAYPQIRIAEVNAGYNGTTGWRDGWTMGLETDLTAYTNVVEATVYGTPRTKSADKLTTTRTVNGVPFDGTSNITVADATKLPTVGGTISGSLTINGTLTNTRFSSTVPYSFLNGSSAQAINVGGLLVSNTYADASKVPTDGAYVKGEVIALGGFTGLLNGNAATASSLTGARNIALTGDVTWSANFDGSADVSAYATLSDTGVTPGTYRSLTVDAKGRISDAKTVVSGLVTATTAAGTSNVVTANTTTYLNLVETVGNTPTSVGASTQITGAGTVSVASDAAGKLTITGAQSITGNAATATTAAAATTLTSVDSRAIKPAGVPKKVMSSYFASVNGLNSDTTSGGYIDLAVFNSYADSSGGKVNALAFSKSSMSITHYQAGVADVVWGVGKTLAYVTDNVASATQLATSRLIGNIPFDGTANINLPGVNIQGNQDTTGNAATATKLSTPVNINGVPFDGASAITVFDNSKAPLGSPNFTGTPTGPTAATTANTTQLATTAFVQAVNVADTGSSSTALTLKTPRVFNYTGDINGSVEFNGGSDVTANLTLANSGAVAGTYKAVTVDAKGRVVNGVALITGLVTATTSAGTANAATTNTNTFLNVVETVGGAPSTAGTSTQITGTGSVTVSSDAAGKLTVTGAQTITGNAATATKLATPRALNGINFDGSAAITIPVSVGNIAASSDLNTFQTAGFYSCPATATAASLLNCPTAVAFSLLVEKHAGVKQTLTEYLTANPKTYSRNFYGSWSAWYRVYTTIDPPTTVTGNAGTATKLATPRAINGIPFDGSADITLDQNNGVFLGSVQWYNGNRNSVPDGYVTLDGQLLNRSAFPDLWAAISGGAYPLVTEAVWLANDSKRASYSSGNGTTTFRLPDLNGVQSGSLKGLFARGDGNGTIAGVTVASGQTQSDAIRNITGDLSLRNANDVDNLGISQYSLTTGAFKKSKISAAAKAVWVETNYSYTNTFSLGLDASNVVPTANENRPVAAIGVWIVRAIGSTSPLPASGSPATLLANTFNGSQKVVGNEEVTGTLTVGGDVNASSNMAVNGNLTVNGSNNLAVLGPGTWVNMISSRAINTLYYNTSPKPIMLSIEYYYAFGSNPWITISLDGRAGCPINEYVIVPPGASYKVGADGYYVNAWWERIQT